MKKLMILTTVGLALSLCAKADINKPDFAYPRQVITDAEQAIKTSQKVGDGIGTLQALMQIAVANNSIDNDSAQYAARRVLAAAAKERQPQVKSLMDLYAASIVNSIYSRRKYVYDRRQLPASPRPSDMSEWSGEMFNTVIDSLCNLSWANAGDMAISNLSRVVEADDLCQRYYPTLADFVASQIITTYTHDEALTKQVAEAMLTRHSKYSAGWCNWQAQKLTESNDQKGLVSLYFDAPTEYRSNAAVAFSYLAGMSIVNELSDSERLQYVANLQQAKKELEDTWAEKAVQRLLDSELQPSLNMNVPGMVAADTPFNIEVKNVRNVKTLTLKATDSNKKTITQTYAINHDTPVKADTTLQMQLPHGTYQIKASVADGDVSQFTVKAVKTLPQTIYNENFAAVHVIDAVSGESVPNVSVTIYSGKKTVATAVSDKSGIAKFAAGISGNVRLTQGELSQDFSDVYLRKVTNSKTAEKTSSSITTDRPVYLPGDTVRWAGLISAPDKVVSGKTVTVSLLSMYDREKISTITTTTDEFGRISGEFVIADDVKAGTYGISCDGGYGTQAAFAVGDFKPQSMRLTDLTVWSRKDMAQAAAVTGTVVNYSNFGIDNADIECTIGDTSVHTTTDTNGAFEAIVSYPADTRYSATLTVRVVAADGSTITQSTSFKTEYPYTITLSDLDTVCDAEKDITFTAKITDAAKQQVDTPLHWTLSDNNNKEIKTGAITAQGQQAIDLKDVAAGSYYLSVAADSTALADAVKRSIMLYNPTRKELPVDQCIWLRNTEPISKADADNTVSLTIGVRDDNTVIYTYIESANAAYTAHRFDAGYHTLTVDLGAAQEPGNTLRIAAVRNADTQSYEIEIPETTDKQLKVVTESFRDKIYASTPESWRISITDAAGKKVQSAMTLTMYDKRLDDLYTGRKSTLYIMRYRAQRDLYYALPYNSSRYVYVYKNINGVAYTSLEAPQWLYPMTSSRYLLGTTRRMAKGSRASTALYAASADTDEVAVAEVAEAKLMMASAVKTEDAENESDSGEDTLDDVQLRNTTNYVALWRPTLVSDAAGNYDINFMVPNANTTWQLQGFAWTKDGKSVDISHTFVAAKPVMVSVNTPRFVRTGDKAVVAISVMNNSADEQRIKLVAQVAADTVGATPLTQRIVEMTLNAGASDIAYITLDAAQTPVINAEQVYVTAKVSNGTFSDGERVSVPVLASQTLVVDSKNFYINPGEKSFDIDLPAKTGDNHSNTLTFTENPMWTVVESLPILTSDDKVWNTAGCQASAFFAATTALSLQKQHSELELEFSVKDMERVQKNALQKLIELQYSDGGWRWGRWCTASSKYTTAAVLGYMATLKRAGYLPADGNLSKMIERALKFYDSAVEDVDMAYTITRTAFADVTQSLNGKKVSDATVQYINKNWKKFDVSTKATAATALQYTGNRNMAKTLIGSLNEFGTQTNSKGFEFMNVRTLPTYARLLHAYAAVTPTSEHVDGLRQYLIVRKQATDWGNYATTSDIVASMINSGTKWTVPAEGVSVSVDGTELDVHGSGRMGTLTTKVSGQHLSISLAGTTPAYGAVISRYNAEMMSVEAYSDSEISVTKDMYVQRDGKWQEIDTLRVGDKVKIVLTVKASRPFSELVITDDRAAAFMPKEQQGGWTYGDGIMAYRENRNSATNLYVNYMSKGTYKLEYEMSVNNAGTFASGIATVTCAQAPELTAHSAGTTLQVKPKE